MTKRQLRKIIREEIQRLNEEDIDVSNIESQLDFKKYDIEQVDDRTYDINGATVFWGAATEKEYEKAEKLIDRTEIKTKYYKIYCWYDDGGYSYWMEQQEEQNYINVTLEFKTDKIPSNEIPKLIKDIKKIIYAVDKIESKYDFDPNFRR